MVWLQRFMTSCPARPGPKSVALNVNPPLKVVQTKVSAHALEVRARARMGRIRKNLNMITPLSKNLLRSL
jgi:hypothetical protein